MTLNRAVTKPPQSRAFFFEMLLNMLIFALCTVVALQVFVEAKVSIDSSTALTHLTLQAESLAEAYKSTNGEITELSAALGIESDGKPVTQYYDANLDLTAPSNAKYSLVCTISDRQPLHVGTITAYQEDEELFCLEVKNYQPRKAGS